VDIIRQIFQYSTRAPTPIASALTKLLKKLPGVSTQLTAANQKRVQGTVNNLAKVLDAMHEVADEEGGAFFEGADGFGWSGESAFGEDADGTVVF